MQPPTVTSDTVSIENNPHNKVNNSCTDMKNPSQPYNKFRRQKLVA